MNRKIKLISSISTFVLCVAVLVFGVFATTTQNLSVGGNFTYDAVNIQATVSAASVGAGPGPAEQRHPSDRRRGDPVRLR